MSRGPKKKLTLQNWTDVSDGMGGFTRTYSDVSDIYGVLATVSATERMGGGNKEAVYSTHRFYMGRISTTITEKDHRFISGSRVFDIVAVNDPAQHDRFAIIDLKEVR